MFVHVERGPSQLPESITNHEENALTHKIDLEILSSQGDSNLETGFTLSTVKTAKFVQILRPRHWPPGQGVCAMVRLATPNPHERTCSSRHSENGGDADKQLPGLVEINRATNRVCVGLKLRPIETASMAEPNLVTGRVCATRVFKFRSNFMDFGELILLHSALRCLWHQPISWPRYRCTNYGHVCVTSGAWLVLATNQLRVCMVCDNAVFH